MVAPDRVTAQSWLQALGRFALVAAMMLATLTGCTFFDELDRCLDRGGRWNDVIDVCELEPQGTNDAFVGTAPTTANLFRRVGGAGA